MSIETGLWFLVMDFYWEDIDQIRISLPGAFNDRGTGFTNDFNFTIDVVDWDFEVKQP
ncbi:MAG: hypothetical protein WA116_10365 [Anaerolineaceae bacterium]